MRTRWVALVAVLSIVLPLALLTTLKWEGILGGQSEASETLTLETVAWELERPGGGFPLNSQHKADRAFGNGEIEIYIDATPSYFADSYYYGRDMVAQQTTINASIAQGFIKDVRITFHDVSSLSLVGYSPTFGPYPDGMDISNLKLDSYASWTENRWLLRGDMKAFINLTAVNRPRNVLFRDRVEWYLVGNPNQTHQLHLGFEMRYFNGSIYKELIQPFDMKIERDTNDSFETAQELSPGVHSYLFIGVYDLEDFYRIDLASGDRLTIHVMAERPDLGLRFNVSLYDSNKVLRATFPAEGFLPKEINETITADTSGYWFLRIIPWDYGFYTLEAEIQ